MSLGRFAMGFLLVGLMSYAYQAAGYWVPLEFSYFLIFNVILHSSERRALVFTFLVTLGLDLMLQTGQLKGITCVPQLLLVYGIMKLKRNVVPHYQDVFLLFAFALFYLSSYYLNLGVSHLLGSSFYSMQPLRVMMVIFLTLFHTAAFGCLLFLKQHFARRTK